MLTGREGDETSPCGLLLLSSLKEVFEVALLLIVAALKVGLVAGSLFTVRSSGRAVAVRNIVRN